MPDSGQLKFLLLHDHGDGLEKAFKCISCMGYEVIDAGNAKEALGHIHGEEFIVAIVDAGMKNADGLKNLREISGSGSADWLIALGDNDLKKSVFELVPRTGEFYYMDRKLEKDRLQETLARAATEYAQTRENTERKKRVSHLEVINGIARETLHAASEDILLWNIAQLIHKKLYHYHNVNIFITENKKVVLKAFAGGGEGDDFNVGYSLRTGEGIVGWVAQHRQPLVISDMQKDPRANGFLFEKNMKSELAVPVMLDSKLLGVLHVGSVEANAFTAEDLLVLQTVGDQMALAFEKWRLSKELYESYSLSSAINDSMPVSIILVDSDLHIAYVNGTYCETVGVRHEDVIGQPVLNYFSREITVKNNFAQKLKHVFDQGIPISFTNVRSSFTRHPTSIYNITFVQVQAAPHPRVMILVQDVTDFSRKTEQLNLLREISIALQGVLEREKLLHMILTSVTAEFAIGLNRAFLFLLDKTRGMLYGTMYVGPVSQDEAHRIWNDLSLTGFSFEMYMDKLNRGEISTSGLQTIVEQIAFDMHKIDNILTETVKTKQHQHILNALENPKVDSQMKKLLASNEFVTIPLIAKNEVLGVILADNAYSGKPITEDMISELSMFSVPSALAIDNLNLVEVLEEKIDELEKAYIELEKTHDKLIQHEKLAAVGEVSARLAHEIRNPLSTIGGFAKSIPRKYDNKKLTIRNANIIVEEVRRLEHILTNVLDFTKAGIPQKSSHEVNDLIKDTLEIMRHEAAAKNITIIRKMARKKLETHFDLFQIKQVLINIIQNSYNAMPDGGTLEIKTSENDTHVFIEIRDTGKGIPRDYLDNIFDPFFTTRGNGTGLGLAISQRIIQNHEGELEIQSEVSKGTLVTIKLPKIE